MKKELKVGDSTDCFPGACVKVPIEPYFAGSYKLEYDGKYITLIGKDKTYEVMRFSDDQPVDYEEMVLVSCVLEVRKANPKIVSVTDEFITIDLGCSECV